MKYLTLVILALFVIGLFAGCAATTQPPADNSAATGNVATEAGNAVDSAVIDGTEKVQIGEMI